MSTAIAVAGVAVLSGGVLAATNGHRGGQNDEVIDKVAEILQIDSDELGEALAQARTEVRQEQRDERLDQLVADGTLTPEQVAEIQEWEAARPAVLEEIGAVGQRGRGHQGDGPVSERQLAQLVDDGMITREQAEEVLAWLDARPDALSEVRPNHGRSSFGQQRRGGHGFGGRFQGSFEGQFRGRFPGGFEGFGQLFGERFHLEMPDGLPGELPGVESDIELIIPPTNGTSA